MEKYLIAKRRVQRQERIFAFYSPKMGFCSSAEGLSTGNGKPPKSRNLSRKTYGRNGIPAAVPCHRHCRLSGSPAGRRLPQAIANRHLLLPNVTLAKAIAIQPPLWAERTLGSSMYSCYTDWQFVTQL
jgi:hypothetical protein